jgi:hypothetical protein
MHLIRLAHPRRPERTRIAAGVDQAVSRNWASQGATTPVLRMT